MKIMLAAAIAIGLAGLCRAESNYYEAYQEGYKAGHREANGQFSIAPIPPMAPLPELGKGSDQDAYNRGLIEAYEKEKAEQSGWQKW